MPKTLQKTIRTGRELLEFAAKGDVWHATMVNELPALGHKYKKGQNWSFWMEDDPRFDDGILKLGTWKCIRGGNDDTSRWEKIA